MLHFCSASCIGCWFASGCNLRCWLSPLKPFMTWVQVIWRTLSNGINPSHLCQQSGFAACTISQEFLIGGVQEKILFYHGSCPLEHHIPQGEIQPSPLLTFCEDLALPAGPQWGCTILEVAFSGLGKTPPLPVFLMFLSSPSFNNIYYCYCF